MPNDGGQIVRLSKGRSNVLYIHPTCHNALKEGVLEIGDVSVPTSKSEREREILLENDDYQISYFRGLTEILFVAFISAGGTGVGETVEELRKSLRSYSASLVFVNNRKKQGYNSIYTSEMFELLSEISARHNRVFCIGESMGRCGAIYSTNKIPNVERVLAFAPQYSLKPPFIDFDAIYKTVGTDRWNNDFYIEDFGTSKSKDKCVILYGNNAWQDLLHRSMYEARGFTCLTVDIPHHAIASHLKHHRRLAPLLALFMNAEADFSAISVGASIGDQLSTVRLRDDKFRIS